MIKVLAILFAINAANPTAEPQPIAKFASNATFNTEEECKAAAEAIVGDTIKNVNAQLAQRGVRVVMAQVACGDPKDLEGKKEDNSI